MKYAKMLGLLAVAAAALMAFAGTASATLTSPAGTSYGGTIEASSTNSQLDGSVTISCKKSTVKGTPSSTGSTSGNISSLTFSECGGDTVSVIAGGSLAIASNGAVTSTGAEVTVLTHTPFFNITIHCIYKTNKTSVGTLTEGTAPVLNIGSKPIPESPTDGSCGEDAEWTGSYSVTTPHELIVD